MPMVTLRLVQQPKVKRRVSALRAPKMVATKRWRYDLNETKLVDPKTKKGSKHAV